MAEEDKGPDQASKKKPKRSLGERIHEHFAAAQVAAEEAAGYGWATETVEAVEAAVDPEHELGGNEEGKPPADGPGREKEHPERPE